MPINIPIISPAIDFLSDVFVAFTAWALSIDWVEIWMWIGVVSCAVGLFWYIFGMHWGGTD